jgi:hypothetical protein
MNAIVMTIAMCYALEEVKAVILRQQGPSALREVKRAALVRLAAAYLESHPEILERAAQTVRSVPTLRRMAQRGGREKRKTRFGLRVNGHHRPFT